MGVSTMEPLLPAATTSACPGLAGPTYPARVCSQAREPSCGPKSVPMERLTTTGSFIESARSKRNATPRSSASLPIESLPGSVMRAMRSPAWGATPR